MDTLKYSGYYCLWRYCHKLKGQGMTSIKIGKLTFTTNILNLVSGDAISLEIKGQLSEKVRIDLYMDYAPTSTVKFAIRGQITEYTEDKDA